MAKFEKERREAVFCWIDRRFEANLVLILSSCGVGLPGVIERILGAIPYNFSWLIVPYKNQHNSLKFSTAAHLQITIHTTPS